MHRWSGRRQPRYISNIQLIPYMDLIFVILFVCILISPLLSRTEVGSAFAQADTTSPILPKDYVVLEERTDGYLIFNGKHVSSTDLRRDAAALAATRPSVAVVLNLEPTSAITRAVTLSSELRLAGIRKIAINTK